MYVVLYATLGNNCQLNQHAKIHRGSHPSVDELRAMQYSEPTQKTTGTRAQTLHTLEKNPLGATLPFFTSLTPALASVQLCTSRQVGQVCVPQLSADVVLVEAVEVLKLLSQQLGQRCVVLLSQLILLQLQRTLHYALHLLQAVLGLRRRQGGGWQRGGEAVGSGGRREWKDALLLVG